jgi:phosphoribosylpyrophosphate synthetase
MAKRNPKLLVVPCSGGETLELAKGIYSRLLQVHGLGSDVELLEPKSREKIDKSTKKNHLHPPVADFFPDGEVQADIGRSFLEDTIERSHILLVEHLLTPVRTMFPGGTQSVSVNDHIMAVRGILDLIRNIKTVHSTLLTPYSSYVRSHSIEKYEARGFFQFDSLRRMLKDFKNDGLGTMAAIDIHSMKAAQIAEELGLYFHAINPFQSARGVNPYKLGATDAETAAEVINGLRPFQGRFKELKKSSGGHLYVISVDDGTEKRTENFTERAFLEREPEELYALIAYFDKDRVSYADSTAKFKPFSQINEENIDSKGTYIVIDDMFASGGTAGKVAHILKGLGAKRVEVWTSHAVTMPQQYEKANDRSAIDQVVCLDTVPQSSDLNIEYIKASADLLAAEAYKIHGKVLNR